MKGSLAQALRSDLSAEDRERLIEFMETLPEEMPALEPDPGEPG
jgi:hypothetical protein